MNALRTALVLLVLPLAVLGCASASGSSVVTGARRAPIAAGQVKLYLAPPAKFEVIGLVSASSGAGWTDQGSVNHAMAELQRQAAKLGANGLLTVSTEDTITTVVSGSGTAIHSGPAVAKTVKAKAIFVQQR